MGIMHKVFVFTLVIIFTECSVYIWLRNPWCMDVCEKLQAASMRRVCDGECILPANITLRQARVQIFKRRAILSSTKNLLCFKGHEQRTDGYQRFGPRTRLEYKLYIRNKTWHDSQAHCKRDGASLMSFWKMGKREYRKLARIMKILDGRGSWIGLNDRYGNDSWYWLNGRKLNDRGENWG